MPDPLLTEEELLDIHNNYPMGNIWTRLDDNQKIMTYNVMEAQWRIFRWRSGLNQFSGLVTILPKQVILAIAEHLRAISELRSSPFTEPVPDSVRQLLGPYIDPKGTTLFIGDAATAAEAVTAPDGDPGVEQAIQDIRILIENYVGTLTLSDSTEAQERRDSDQVLETNLNNEITNRKTAETAIIGRLDALEAAGGDDGEGGGGVRGELIATASIPQDSRSETWTIESGFTTDFTLVSGDLQFNKKGTKKAAQDGWWLVVGSGGTDVSEAKIPWNPSRSGTTNTVNDPRYELPYHPTPNFTQTIDIVLDTLDSDKMLIKVSLDQNAPANTGAITVKLYESVAEGPRGPIGPPGPKGGDRVIVELTLAEYNALNPKVADTLYAITSSS